MAAASAFARNFMSQTLRGGQILSPLTRAGGLLSTNRTIHISSTSNAKTTPTMNTKITSTRKLQYKRGKATVAAALNMSDDTKSTLISSVLPSGHCTTKIFFSDKQAADYKYIWLRDNCPCPQCRDQVTKQKLLDTIDLDVNINPDSVNLEADGNLKIVWGGEDKHVSIYDPKWLFKYRDSFVHDSFENNVVDSEALINRSEPVLWDRTEIWENLPELSYKEFMETDQGLYTWLDMFYKYGIALLRGVPTEKSELQTVVERFAYIKQTRYGMTFDVVNDPKQGHLAYSGVALAYHTDMNYREKSPGMQALHCLKANDAKITGEDYGGRSMFVDGMRAARWLEEHEPTAFQVLTHTPVRFTINHLGKKYSALFPIICTNNDGDVTEIHVNNRTMQPLQAPSHIVKPFYHAYKLFCNLLNDSSAGLEFNMVPGDLVMFNNRRVLHARSAYDASKVERHLHGCYIDIDEAFCKYDELSSLKR